MKSSEWNESTLGSLCKYVARGITPKYVEDNGIVVLNQKCIRDFRVNIELARKHDLNRRKVSEEKMLCKNDVLVNSTGVGTAGRVAQWESDEGATCDSHITIVRPDGDKIDEVYFGYAVKAQQALIETYAEGSTGQTEMNKQRLCEEIVINYPEDKLEQKKIAKFLSDIDEKIVLNTKINENLEQQAQSIFNNMFPNVSSGENSVGDTIIPRRGKGLLSKDAVLGEVPVVAGGLEPATYHNVANTIEPVLVISASGANAGYVSLWNIPVWSSDSSYIDSSMTDDVYFWYVLLKKRQREIFDAQTGSAQPHIYPQHIAAMPVINLKADIITDIITEFTDLVTPLFKTIGHNKEENIRLVALRNNLLPKLMVGELSVSEIEI